jgi:2-hydroxychromene-2-carboxylate isomerase
MGPEPLKLYYDYKSPFAYLAAEPAFSLPERFAVELRWIPFQLRLKGKGERSQYSEWKARYSYFDARRWANRRGGFQIRGPKKVYDSRPALIGGLFATREGCFREYTLGAYARFFDHQLELDLPEDVAAFLDEVAGRGMGARYLAYLAGEGAEAFDAAMAEAHADQVFGVPLFFFRGEPFWGHDRMPLLEERLGEAGLQR